MWSRWNNGDGSAAGLALLASDVQQALGCGDTDFSTSTLPMAQVLATNDGLLSPTRVALNSAFNSNATFVMDIYGANHASFGNYNSSGRGLLGQLDGQALIPDHLVWELAASAIVHVAARTGASLAIPKEINATEDRGDISDRCPPSSASSFHVTCVGTAMFLGVVTALAAIVV